LRREKGLCYFYYEKFTFNHKCPYKLLMLQNEEEDSESDNAIETTNSVTQTNSGEGLVDNHHLSLNAMKEGLRVSIIHFTTYINT